mmetsp:Transcript_12215/g.23817  ORF Transcript_12215/g.23817 Transcript_12215/m.23817 type:complete len:242 (+) Transcript_12215:376-1101(+)
MYTMKSFVTMLAVLSGAAALVTTTGGHNEVRRASISQSIGLVLESSTMVDKETTNLSPFLQEMVDEQRELQMDVGKSMDVLRKDYPYFLKRAPDFSIYHDSIKIKDSTGKAQLSKLSSYKNAFYVMRTMISLIYDTDRSVLQNRMVYDSTRTQIRVSFNAMLVPKLGGRPVHVDGISVYSIDSIIRDGEGKRRDKGGKIVEHKIEKMLVNGNAIQPPYFGVFGFAQGAVPAGALAGAGAWS